MKRLMADPLYAPATDIRSSFRAAVASATAGHEVTLPRGGSAADTDDDDDEAGDGADDDEVDESAAGDDDETGEGEDEGEEPGEDGADEGDDDEEAEGEGDGEEGEGEEETDDEEPNPQTSELLSDKEIKAIQRAHPNDPQAQIKAYQRAFTKKTQALAGESKSYKGLLSYLPLVKAYEENPIQTITRLARMNGMKIAEVDGEPTLVPGGRGKGKTAADATDDTKDFIEKVVTKFKSSLGPELEYMGDTMGPAMAEAMQAIADHVAGNRVKGLEEATGTLARDTAEAQSDRVMDTFYRVHKDAKDPEFEAEMNELAQALTDDGKGGVRAVGMSEADFLDFLYKTVKNNRTASTSKETIEKEARRLMKKRLAKLGTARNGERRATATVTDEKIHRRPRGSVDIRQAFKAAKAGIRFDDNEDDDE